MRTIFPFFFFFFFFATIFWQQDLFPLLQSQVSRSVWEKSSLTEISIPGRALLLQYPCTGVFSKNESRFSLVILLKNHDSYEIFTFERNPNVAVAPSWIITKLIIHNNGGGFDNGTKNLLRVDHERCTVAVKRRVSSQIGERWSWRSNSIIRLLLITRPITRYHLKILKYDDSVKPSSKSSNASSWRLIQ